MKQKQLCNAEIYPTDCEPFRILFLQTKTGLLGAYFQILLSPTVVPELSTGMFLSKILTHPLLFGK